MGNMTKDRSSNLYSVSVYKIGYVEIKQLQYQISEMRAFVLVQLINATGFPSMFRNSSRIKMNSNC